MPLSYLIWTLIIIVCCALFVFMDKGEEDKKCLWKKIALIGFCAGTVQLFAVDLTIDMLLALNRQEADWFSERRYILRYFSCASVFIVFSALVYFISYKVRPFILYGIILLFGCLFIFDVYANNYDYATGKDRCGYGQLRVTPAYVQLLWCPKG